MATDWGRAVPSEFVRALAAGRGRARCALARVARLGPALARLGPRVQPVLHATDAFAQRAAHAVVAALDRIQAALQPLAGATWRAARDFTAWTCRLSQGGVGRVARASIAFSLGLSTLAAAGLYETLFLDPFGLPDLDTFLATAPRTIGRIEDSRGEVLAELAREYRRPLADHDLPPVMRRALLAAEDKDFFQHPGVDVGSWPRVVAKTLAASWSARRISFPQGGSTLTQQLVRVAFLHDWWTRENGEQLLVDSVPNRLLAGVVGVRAANKARRKLEELRLALWLEDALARRLGSRRRAKEEILRRYSMYIYLGEGRYGFAAASEHYFGRRLATLRDEEAGLAALLAGIPKSPRAYSPSERNRARVLRRRNLILHQMERAGFLSGEERARLEWEAVPVRTLRQPDVRPDSAAAVNYALEALATLEDPTLTSGAVFDGHIRLQSTIDARLQKVVSEALEGGLRAYDERHPAEPGLVQGSAVVLANADGRILAMVGGRVTDSGEAAYREFNRATMSFRQAGSTMKPLVYLAALRQGLTLDSQVLDTPVWLPMGRGRQPKPIANYDGVFKGPISLRRALAESRNAATVRLATQVGIPELVRTAHELGIRSELAPYLTTALGASEVSLLELANVYRAIASGRRAEPWILRGVVARDGTLLYTRRGEALSLDEPALPLIQEALRGTVRLPGGTGHSLSSLPFAVMGKTGTTNGFRDALFVGSTFGPAGVTMAVRIGFDDNRTLGEGETGGRAAMPVFREAVANAYASGALGPPPVFPERLERGINRYISVVASAAAGVPAGAALVAAAPASDEASGAAVPELRDDLGLASGSTAALGVAAPAAPANALTPLASPAAGPPAAPVAIPASHTSG